MADLAGRKMIAELLGVPCNQVHNLHRAGLPVTFQGRRMVAQTEAIDAWKQAQGVLKCRIMGPGFVLVDAEFIGRDALARKFGLSRKGAARLLQTVREG